MKKFSDFNLSKETEQAVLAMGFEEATPIQAEAIPIALAGKDIIGQAQTGTGKTTAFGIPLIEKCDREAGTLQAIVLAPTRELAVQVAEELNRIGSKKGIRTVPIYGGQEITRQIKALKQRPQIIAATPGRLIDHMRRKTVRLNDIKMVVLDEADEMLNMGFIEEIETILEGVTSPHQTLLFSATMPPKMQALAGKFMQDPQSIKVKSKELTVKNIEQSYIEVAEKQKFELLCRLLDLQTPELSIIFGRTKKRVDELAEGLKKRGYSVEGIHGDLTQSKRNHVIRLFKEQTIDIMVATDVAARGIDVSGVTHIFNFDIPQDPESYVHRIGRTGRAGNKGHAITFVTTREMSHLKTIEEVTKSKIKREATPSYKDVIAGNKQSAIDTLVSTAQEDNLNDYKELAQELLNDTDSISLVSAALKLLTKEPDKTPVELTAVAPVRSKRRSDKNDKRKRGSRDRRKDSRTPKNRRNFKERDRKRSKKREN